MRILDQAIEERLYENDGLELEDQCWECLERAAEEQGIWIFGVGEGADFYLRKYEDRFKINGFLDNSLEKQGEYIDNYIFNK